MDITKEAGEEIDRLKAKDVMEKIFLATIRNKASEMTGGNTSDPLEAFEQWQQERDALVEFYDIAQAQGILLGRIKDQWDTLAGLLWGREKKPEAYMQPVTKVASLIKLRDTCLEIGRLINSNDELDQAIVTANQEYIQLPLFKDKKGGTHV